MRAKLIQFLLFLLKALGAEVIAVPAYMKPILEVAEDLCSMAQTHSGDPSGEWKRGNVYGRMIKVFPQASRKDLALAIELVLSKHTSLRLTS